MENIVQNGIFNIICSIIATIIGAFLLWIFTWRKKLFIYIKSLGKKEIRFSMSYLFRIKIDEKYLLIKGGRIEQYQPIGGVYKYYDSFKEKYEKWNIKNDENIPYDEYSKKDLRIKVPTKHILSFLKWFESRKNREVCVFREFNEEVLKEIPDLYNKFSSDFKAELVKTNITGVKYKPYYKCYEVLIAEIFNLNLNNEQIKILKELADNNKFKFVSREEIEKMSIIESGKSFSIGENSIWTL